MQVDDVKPTSPREIMSRAEKIVTLPTLGWNIKIRKIGNLDLLSFGMDNPISVFSAINKKEKKKDEDKTEEEIIEEAQQIFKSSKIVVMAGTVMPRVVDRPWDEIDQDEEIHVSVVDTDLVWLAMTIMDHSGITEGSADSYETFFRGSVPAGTPPDGESLRETPDGDPGASAPGVLGEFRDLQDRDEMGSTADEENKREVMENAGS